MPVILATREKTWQLRKNASAAGGANVYKNTVLNIIANVTAFSAFPWTVVSSSNGATVGAGLRVSVLADVVFGNGAGTVARTWILFRTGSGRQILFDCWGSGTDKARISMSPAGLFTGGTVSAKPTATDELFKNAGTITSNLGDASFQTSMAHHFWQSSDGRQTMIAGAQRNAGINNDGAFFLWLFGEVEQPPVAWANPCVMWTGDVTGNPGNNMIRASGGTAFSGEVTPGVNASINMATMFLFTGGADSAVWLDSVMNRKNQLTNRWQSFDKMWFTTTNTALFAQLGYWPDMFPTYQSQTGYLSGDHIPGAGTRQWVKWGDLILPWDGGAAMNMS